MNTSQADSDAFLPTVDFACRRVFTATCPGGASERPPTSIVVTHCECDSADADLFSAVLLISSAPGSNCDSGTKLAMKREIIIKDTHRGLWYEDGVLTKVIEAGRYQIPL